MNREAEPPRASGLPHVSTESAGPATDRAAATAPADPATTHPPVPAAAGDARARHVVGSEPSASHPGPAARFTDAVMIGRPVPDRTAMTVGGSAYRSRRGSTTRRSLRPGHRTNGQEHWSAFVRNRSAHRHQPADTHRQPTERPPAARISRTTSANRLRCSMSPTVIPATPFVDIFSAPARSSGV
jgi:hypothetical protein